MTSVNEIINKHQSGFVYLQGYFYVLGGKNITVFISDKEEFMPNDPFIMLPSNIADIVMSQDEILGVLVGGIYLYYSVRIEIEGDISFSKECACFENIYKLVLFNDDVKQSFII
ncbi:hypothetical protein RHO14_07775 [Orbus wheelerorum]|uniref:hypothetical protein n=1 Tax=Orbus wheelerorum TaxID=3074111 RepID=UPI00370D33D5